MGVVPEEPLLERLLLIPCGLLLLFFGVFLVKPALCLASAGFGARLAYLAAISFHVGEVGALAAAVAGGTVAFAVVLMVCVRNVSTGFVLGVCIALSLLPLSSGSLMLQRLAAAAVMGVAFALLTAAAPREVSIFVTSYGGSFLVWHGLELIDAQAGDPHFDVPAFVSATNVDMWFSVLSFLVVGCLGCCVQLILLGGQPVSSSREMYDPIP